MNLIIKLFIFSIVLLFLSLFILNTRRVRTQELRLVVYRLFILSFTAMERVELIGLKFFFEKRVNIIRDPAKAVAAHPSTLCAAEAC